LTGELLVGALGLVGLALAIGVSVRLGRRAERRRQRRRLSELRGEAREQTERVRYATSVLESVLETVPDAVFLLDHDSVVRSANGVAGSWFGGGAPLEGQSLVQATRSAELQTFVRFPEPDERTVHVGRRTMLARARTLANGGALLVLRDDTLLERLERSRRDLVANISHDIRTPLTSLGLLAETLVERPPSDPSRFRALVQQIQQQVAQLRALAEGLLELSRLEEGRSLLRLKPESIAEIVTETVKGLSPQIDERDVTVTVDVPAFMNVLADRPALRRALSNVLDNAIRYSPRGGEVRIAARNAGADEVVVTVSDSGPGIAPSERERVFERFYRGDRSRGGEGAGLGLAIARHILRGHGGEAAIESGGTGTTVRLTLIASTEPAPVS
jgi:two-component system phosphate regulon sensor histidine kinase PhoR